MSNLSSINIETNTNTTRNETTIELELGDVIHITDPKNDKINEQTFLIEYIDKSKMFLINIDSFEKLKLKLNEDGSIGDGTITRIAILSRSDVKGYARQNNLLPKTWINIYFEGDVPVILTGLITNIEEDMIELKLYPDNDIIYINFDYKGIPEDLPIQNIEIREEPQKIKDTLEKEVFEVDEEFDENLENLEEEKAVRKIQTEKLSINIPVKNIKDQLREFIISADQITFGDEVFGPVVQYVDVASKAQRYSIETQLSDLLDEFLSTIPNNQRTTRVLNNIHIIIERFKQLREKFSVFDKYGNVESTLKYESNYKPLVDYFENFKHNLFWILPVVKNIKKIYNANSIDELENNDIVNIDIIEDMSNIKSILDNYKTNSLPQDQSKYSVLYSELNSYFTPFFLINDENNENIISEKMVNNDINVIIDNLDDMYSSIFTNNNIKIRRFVVQKYNLGLNKLEGVDLTGSKNITKSVKLTLNDTMSIKSFITLPEPVIRFSRINLPSTNILDKAKLNQTFIHLWQFLKKKTSVNNIFVDNLDSQINFNEENFVNNIKNFVLNISSDELKELTQVEIYKKFIQTIIPKIKVLFNLMKKYINGKLSIVDVVSYLEPFLIYTDNLTYMQYVEIIKFINYKISEFNKSFSEKSRLFLLLSKVRSEEIIYSSAFSIINLLDKNEKKDEILEEYNIQIKQKEFTNSEILRKLIVKDLLKLYSTSISFQNIPLMFPNEFSSLFEKETNSINKKIDKFSDSDSESCKNIVVAKIYRNIEQLTEDNNREIYFDKMYDSTNYGIIDNYENDILKMSPEEFMIFLSSNLKKKMNLDDNTAEYLAETLINGYKKVIDGQYALLYKGYKEKTNEEYDYYLRKNNEWVLDESSMIDKSVISDSSDILCNLQEKCISIPTSNEDKCENMELNELSIQKNLLKKVVNEFDEKYKISKDEFQEKIQKRFDYYLSIMSVLSKIETNKMLKYNNEKYKLSFDENENVEFISPYMKLRDLILLQEDFVKKQNDIIRFVNLYTRRAFLNGLGPLGEHESPHWLYCIKTNVKLLPLFKFDLASVYLTNKDEYLNYIEMLKMQIGKLSDDGEAWVDEHSGWKIINIDFDIEEGYEASGFKISTRGELEGNIGDNILLTSSKKLFFNSPENKMISNIVNALTQAMGISSFDEQTLFIINCVNISLQNIENEKEYNKKIKDLSNKTTKTLLSYTEFYNSVILYYTLGMFLISVQTNIPSIKTRKTFPGCVKSFSGYPFEGNDDYSSLNYLACVTYNIRKSRSEPWNVLTRVKESAIAMKIKSSIDEILLSLPDVKKKIEEKMQFLLLNPGENIISDDYLLSKWTQFLPPLFPFKIKRLINISKEFEKELIHDLKSGSEKQREKILVVETKIIQFSLAVQEKISDIIKKKQVILRKINSEPYLENACCNDKSNISTITYFENEDSDIKEYNKIVNNLTNILSDIISFSNASLFFTNINTKNKYPVLSNDFDDKLIYLAFIHFCKFKSLLPIPENLLPLCDSKPLLDNLNISLNEIIQKLKDDGRNYSNESFLRLLQLVSRNNIIPISHDNLNVSQKTKLFGILDLFETENDEVIDPSFRKLLFNSLDKSYGYDNTITKEVRDLNNFLIKNNDIMKEEIMNFIKVNKSSDITKKTLKNISNFISTISEWSTDNSTRNMDKKISNENIYNFVNFFKTFIDNIVNTFPNIILNNVDYKNIYIQRYLKLSSRHENNIKKYISSYYEKLRNFYDIPILYNLLYNIQKSCKNLVLLSKEISSTSAIKNKDEELISIFDENTSKYIFEFLFLRILIHYIELTDNSEMIVNEIKKPIEVVDAFSVEYAEDLDTQKDEERTETETVFVRGNKKDLKQKTAKLLISFFEIMNKHKETIDYSYENIIDRVFKLKEKEKDIITDRLKNLTDEERNADTILKINKLGVWSKGLQKGLTTYVKDDYDEETQFRENMEKYEKKLRLSNKNVSEQNIENFLDDFIEENDREAEIEEEAYSMKEYTEDYYDGNFEGEEVENFEDYD